MKMRTGPSAMALFLGLALVASPGCGGGGHGGQDAGADVPDGLVQPDVAPDPVSDESRPDVPDDALPDDGNAGDDGVEADAGPCDPGEALAKGRDWLEKAEPGFARNELEAALLACPDDTETLFLAGLAEMTYGSEQFVSLLTILQGQGTGPRQSALYPGDVPLDAGYGDASQNEILASRLHHAFMELREHFVRALAHLEALGDRDVSVSAVAMPVYLGIKPTLIFRGHFDGGDVLLMRAVGSLVTGILDVLDGQDLDTDLMSVVAGIDSMFGSTTDFPMISRLVAYLLDEDPRFLTLHPDDGETLFQDARRRFADVGPLLDAAIQKMRALGTDDTDISFVEEQTDGVVVNVRSLVHVVDGNVVEEPWYLILGNPTLQAFRDCSASILTPGQRVTLHGGVIPVLSTVLAGFVRVGVLDMLGIKLPGGIDISALEVDDIQALLRSLLPNVMAFDWGEFFSHPVGLRAWLPAVTTDLPLLQNHIVADWECPTDTAADGWPTGNLRLLCLDDVTLTDAPHFAGTDWATEADGTASAFPVLGFDDPTLNGLVSVDLGGTDKNTDPSTYQPATSTSLNAALAQLLAGVLSLL